MNKHTPAVLKRMLKSYWNDNYDGPSIASDELGRLAVQRIEELEAENANLTETCERGQPALDHAINGCRDRDKRIKELEKEVSEKDRAIAQMHRLGDANSTHIEELEELLLSRGICSMCGGIISAKPGVSRCLGCGHKREN